MGFGTIAHDQQRESFAKAICRERSRREYPTRAKIDASRFGAAVLPRTLKENAVSPHETLRVRCWIMRKTTCYLVGRSRLMALTASAGRKDKAHQERGQHGEEGVS